MSDVVVKEEIVSIEPKSETEQENKPDTDKAECTICKKMISKKNMGKHQKTVACKNAAQPEPAQTSNDETNDKNFKIKQEFRKINDKLDKINAMLDLMGTMLAEMAEDEYEYDD